MSSELISEYAVSHAKPKAFYDRYERKEELQHQTHYCPGCGHGIITRLLMEVIEEMDLRGDAICVAPAGCGMLLYNYFEIDVPLPTPWPTPAAISAYNLQADYGPFTNATKTGSPFALARIMGWELGP